MIVLSLTDCPPSLRGDLTKWLMEVNTGVYVGNVSTRVRDELWERICDHIKNGRATMVYSARNEQGLSFRVHNTRWEPVDYDGLTLMRRPIMSVKQTSNNKTIQTGTSRIGKRQQVKRIQTTKTRFPSSYAVIDIETSGLSVINDQIIELAAIRVLNNVPETTFERLIRFDGNLSDSIVALTGITNAILSLQGVDRTQALREMFDFVGDLPIVSYNATFDIGFLRTACK